MNNFNYERFWIAAQMTGMSMQLFDECVAYARPRDFWRQADKPSSDTPPAADMSPRIDAMDAYSIKSPKLNRGEKALAEISKLKFYCSEIWKKTRSHADYGRRGLFAQCGGTDLP